MTSNALGGMTYAEHGLFAANSGETLRAFRAPTILAPVGYSARIGTVLLGKSHWLHQDQEKVQLAQAHTPD